MSSLPDWRLSCPQYSCVRGSRSLCCHVSSIRAALFLSFIAPQLFTLLHFLSLPSSLPVAVCLRLLDRISLVPLALQLSLTPHRHMSRRRPPLRGSLHLFVWSLSLSSLHCFYSFRHHMPVFITSANSDHIFPPICLCKWDITKEHEDICNINMLARVPICQNYVCFSYSTMCQTKNCKGGQTGMNNLVKSVFV